MDKQLKPEQDFLIEAGVLLASTLDYKVTLANVARLITQSIADWCAIDLFDERGDIQRVTVSHVDPTKQAMAHELQRRYPKIHSAEKHTITQRVLERGETWLDTDVSDVRLAAEARDTEHYLLLKALGFTSEIVVPLIAHGHVLGTLTLVLGEGTRRYDETDRGLAEELARRIALAVDNARLFGEVEAQKEWFQVTLSSIGDGVIATDADACVMFMNPVASALTGWSFEDALGREVETVFHIINEHTRAPVPTPIRQALAQGIKVGLANHTLLIARDGTERPISDSGAPIRDRDGRTIGAVLVFRDVSEQRAAEIALRDSEARYRDLIENANDIIYTLDLAGNLTSLNKAGERILGYSAHELIDQPLALIFETETLEMMQGKLQKKMEGEERTQYEVNVRTKDGRRVTLEINSQLIQLDGLSAGIYGVARDITERRSADEIRARLSAIVEYSDDAIVSKMLDGTIVSWNQGASRIFGYSEAEAVGQSIRILFPPERLYEEDDFLLRISRGEHIDHFETIRVRKDGTRINLSVTLSPIRDASGTIIGVSKIARDITERKRSEQRINLLLELSQAFTQAFTAQQVAEVMVAKAVETLGVVVVTVCLLDEQGMALEILSRGGPSSASKGQYARIPIDEARPLVDAVRDNRLIWIETRADFINRYPNLHDSIERKDSRSVICIPLKIDNQVIGGFNLDFPFEKTRTPDEEAFFTTLANLCAQSLERARLYEEENQARQLAESLQDTGNALNTALELSDVLDQILNNIDRIVPHDLADIMLIDKGIGRIVRSRGYTRNGLVKHEQETEKITVNVAETYYFRWAAENKQPRVVDDATTDPNWVHLQDPDVIRSNIIAPILIDGKIAGFLNVDSLIPNFYTARDADILQTFANQAAIAIKHAQLHEQAVETAAVVERQRIARDLHDAVSQTLFSANLISESLPRLWERSPDRALEQTRMVHQLTQAAAAEMRVLLYELRPESLVNTNLRELLTQLVHAIPGRKEFGLSLIVRGMNDQLLLPDVQVAFYRIAQEGLNNIVKHGGATQARIRLNRTDGQFTLVIVDNGQGFDTSQTAGGIGLKSMRERAGSIGATFDIKSTIGRGTRIRLVWKGDDKRKS